MRPCIYLTSETHSHPSKKKNFIFYDLVKETHFLLDVVIYLINMQSLFFTHSKTPYFYILSNIVGYFFCLHKDFFDEITIKRYPNFLYSQLGATYMIFKLKIIF